MLGHKKNTVPKASHSDKLGIYIHIPFCRSKCDYCDFYSLAGREEQMDRYQKALLAHIRETAPLAQGIGVDSVYFGGGTPSFYGDRRLREVLSLLEKQFSLDRDAEITLEANPDSVDLKSLRRLRKAGFNRLTPPPRRTRPWPRPKKRAFATCPWISSTAFPARPWTAGRPRWSTPSP